MHLSDTEQREIQSAYDLATTRIDALQAANASRASDARSAAIDELTAHQQQIERLGFFEKDDFTNDERTAMLDAAGEIRLLDARLTDAHKLTLMELESDLAQLVQTLSLQRFDSSLQMQWLLGRRRYPTLPREIPQDVRDDYQVTLFTLAQGNLNYQAARLKGVQQLQCLNQDDYNTLVFGSMLLRVATTSGRNATDDYAAIQAAQAALEAEQKANEISVAGVLWSVLGWDDPWDFALDVALFVGTGGASRVIRWGTELVEAGRRVEETAEGAEKLLEIEQRVRRMETRIEEIKKAARQIKRIRKWVRLPQKLRAALKELQDARKQLALVKEVGAKVEKSYVRGVLSTVASRLALRQDLKVGNAITDEMVRTAIMGAIDGWDISVRIKALDANVNFTLALIEGDSAAVEQLLTLFGLLFTREFFVRWAIVIFRGRTLSLQQAVNEAIAAFGAAVEALIVKVPFLSKAEASQAKEYVISGLQSLITSIAQELAKQLFK